MRTTIQITPGSVFGKLTVVSLFSKGSGGVHSRWECRCQCGREIVTRSNSLRGGRTKSCGKCCNANYKHGMKGTPEYESWCQMKQRCLNPNDVGFKDYGGRGIKVCQEWQDSFSAFLQDVGRRPSLSHSIDRIDVNGNYEPGNVKWSSIEEQNRNRRDTRWVVFQGTAICAAEFARLVGVCQSTVTRQLNRGRSAEEIYARYRA